MKKFLSDVIGGKATKDQAKDTGMAVVLILLLFWLYRRQDGFIAGAVTVHLVNMVAPQLFKPLAVIWFGLSHVMGLVASRVLLSIVFFVVVTPIGIMRRLSGADALKLRAFKASKESVMKVRNHTFTAKDLEQPY